jgi:protein involved in polysaccharide export with SLBB domain
VCFIFLSIANCDLNAQTITIDTLNQKIDSLTNLVQKLKGFNENNKIYGHQLFKSDSIKIFNESTITKIPDNYVVGVGDEITVSIFGESQLDGKFEVDKNGFIQPRFGNSAIPKIFLQGLTWIQTKNLIAKRLSRYAIFNRNQIAITLTAPRTVTVNVFGNVNRPGTYSLPATNTAFNAIVAAGGPQSKASVRNIKISDGSGQKNLDIYELMENPIKQFDYYLSDNAIIHLPLAKKVVHSIGPFLRPMDYELVESDDLDDLIGYSGGFRSNANKELLQIKRYTANSLELIDVNKSDLRSNNIDMMNGDSIFALLIEDVITNAVSVEGAVEIDREFSLSSTKTVADLVRKARLKKEAKMDVAYLYRENEDKTSDIIEIKLSEILDNPSSSQNIILQANDRLVILSQSERVTKSFIKVSGEVRKSTTEPFDPDSTLTISKAIELAGGLTDEAENFGYLVRSQKDNPKKKSYLRIDIESAVSKPSGIDNIRLYPQDEIIVLKKSDFSDQFFLTTRGAFRKGKDLYYDPKISIKELVELSNGLKPEASGKIDVYRLITENNRASEVVVASIEIDKDYNIVNGDADFKFEPGDQIIARVKEDIDPQALVSIEGEVNYPGTYSLTSKSETLQDLIKKAGGTTNQAFINGIKLYRSKLIADSDTLVYYPIVVSNSNLDKSKLDILLRSNDKVIIPKMIDIVQIELKNTTLNNLIKQPNSPTVIGVQYVSNKNVKWYINNFVAGIDINSKWKNVIVEYPNGEVKRVSKSWLFFKKYPSVLKGSKIIIGTTQDKTDDNLESINKNMGEYNIPKSVKTLIINETILPSNKNKTELKDVPSEGN